MTITERAISTHRLSSSSLWGFGLFEETPIMRYKVLAKIAACSLFFIFNSLAVRAQFRNAIEGTVAEQSGKVIPGAQMILVNIETGVTQTAKTNSEGSYRFPSLPPGRYKITASSTGFKSATQENITLEGSEVTVTFSLTSPTSSIIGIVRTSEPSRVMFSCVADLKPVDEAVIL